MLKKAFRIFYIVNFCLFIALGSTTFIMLLNNRELVGSYSDRTRALAAVEELKKNYDKLTLYLRYYIITGESFWLERYNELLSIAKGDKPGSDNLMHNWENLLKEYIFTEEVHFLEKSEERWKDQLLLERRAIEADRERAVNIIFSDTYRAYRALTLNPLADFIMHLESRTRRHHENLEQNSRAILTVTVIVVVLCIIVNWTFLIILSKRMLRPVFTLKDMFQKASEGDLKVSAPVTGTDEISQLSASFNKMVEKIHDLFEQTIEEHKARRKAELQVMQAQIKPHFIYNTLEAIILTAENREYERVVTLVSSLSDLFKITLSQGREWISLKEELSHVRSYLEIQQIRYQDILDYKILVDTPNNLGLDSLYVLKLIIQPLVENSIYHGIKKKRARGTVTVRVWNFTNTTFTITVSDTGIGLTEQELGSLISILDREDEASSGFGLRNVHQRLKFCYGQQYGLRIESGHGVGTDVNMEIPLKREEL